MIARIWHGATLRKEGDAYYRYLTESGIPEYQATAGNRGVYVLRRDGKTRTDFLLVSFWDSYDAIRRFAGADVERAVYYPRHKDFLLELEPKVAHYEVSLASPPDGR